MASKYVQIGKVGFKYLAWSIWKDLLAGAKENLEGMSLKDEYPVMSLVSIAHLYLCRFLFYLAIGIGVAIVASRAFVIVSSLMTNHFGIPMLLGMIVGIIVAFVLYLLINLTWATSLMYQDFFKVLIQIKQRSGKR